MQSANAQINVGPTPLVEQEIFSSELFQSKLVFTNSDEMVEVDEVTLDVSENDVAVFSSTATYVDENDAKPSPSLKVAIDSIWSAFQAKLPLKPKTTTEIPFELLASLNWYAQNKPLILVLIVSIPGQQIAVIYL